MKTSYFWKVVYKAYPPLTLRVFEKIGVHRFRCPYNIGYLEPQIDLQEIEKFLRNQGFEYTQIAWKDPGEILNMRKMEERLFQYHIRIFNDKEVRGHHEYSLEDAPLKHILKKNFNPHREYFEELLKNYLAISSSTENRSEAVSK